MPFIIRGKSNLKYILIVAVLALIASGIILSYYYSMIKDLEIKLTKIEKILPEVKPPDVPDIIVSSPKKGEKVETPLVIKGKARGFWFFEADFPIRLLDENGKELAASFAKTYDNWMTEKFVSFEAQFDFLQPTTTRGILVLEKANPSGLPENAEELIIPILFPAVNSINNCMKTGCSNQVCAEKKVITTCEFLPEYSCYQNAICERQSDNNCGWTQTETLLNCLKEARS